MATSSAAFKSFRSSGVVVFANSKTESSSLPEGARAVRSKAGNTIPMVFVTSADGSKGIDGISYASLKDMRKAVRSLKDTLKETDVTGGGEEPADTDETETEKPDGMLAEASDWTNAEGKVINAAVRSIDGGKVEFLIKGRSVKYDISKLSKESQARLEALR